MKALYNRSALASCEFAAAILMSLFLVLLHLAVLLHAGPLWRDEVSSVYVATAPNMKAFLTSLVLDPFPILFVSVLRFWIALGFGGSDFSLRLLGFLIGISLLAAIWVCCRMIDQKRWAPLWPLALFALTPLTLIEGDALRAYGLGLIGIVLSFGFVWRLAFERWRLGIWIAATIAAVAAVQSLYLNSLVLFAICVAGIIVSLRRHQTGVAVGILSVGMIAAFSLLPYANVMYHAREQLVLESEPGTNQSIGFSDKNFFLCATALLLAAGLIAVSVPPLRRSLLARIKGSSDPLVFAMVVGLVSATTTFGFLWSLGLHSPRYHLPFMAAIALSIQVVYATMRKSNGLTIANLVASGLTAAVLIPSSYHLSDLRRTNCDLAAAAVAQSAGEDDLVAVTRFTHATTFDRYYKGTAPWTSVPAVGLHLQHRAYLAQPGLMDPNAIHDILGQIETVLKTGHKVFLVGRFPLSEMGKPFSPAPESPNGSGWKLGVYLNIWHAQIINLLGQHAVQVEKIPLNEAAPIDPQEREQVYVFSGWKD